MTIVAAGALPRYLLSTYYIDWCSTESHQSTGSIAANTVESKVDEVTKELDRIFISSNWLREMLAAVEHIPICITVAAASRAMPGFPLLYVNSAFESTTGYTRQEIIGQNCRFLQLGKLDGEVAEQESISRLSYALSEAKPVRVAITNYRKDGTSFSNLLAMKPIMDEVSALISAYVPLQCTVTHITLFKMLANTLL